jgi:uncharacterized protein (TIGR02265 family)
MGDSDVIFSSTVEGLMRAMGDKLDEAAHRRFAELGLPMKGKLQPTYPRALWIKVCLAAGEVMFPQLPAEQQRIQLGHRFIRGYGETLVGKTLLTAMKLLGPKRSLERLQRSLQTGNNYTKVTLREVEGGFELDLADAPYPEWYQGMFEAALQVTGAKSWSVTPSKRVGNDITYSIKFT